MFLFEGFNVTTWYKITNSDIYKCQITQQMTVLVQGFEMYLLIEILTGILILLALFDLRS